MFSTIAKYVTLFILLSLCQNAQAQKASSFISINDGLVNNEVTSIINDKNGFIWFGTRGGLQRFDGYEMKLLNSAFAKGSNLLNQSIEVLHNGRENNIWVGTKSGGLSEYKLKAGTITNYANNHQNSLGFNADYILSILDTDTEKLLIGTWKGFQYLNKKTVQFSIVSNVWKTFDIQSDGKSGYWLATNSGLRHLNASLQNDTTFNFGIPNINITSIVWDKELNCLWLGTWNYGIFQLDLSSFKFKNFQSNKKNTAGLSSNNTYRLFLDSKNNLWIGTWGWIK